MIAPASRACRLDRPRGAGGKWPPRCEDRGAFLAMIELRDLRYVRLGARNLDDSARFATTMLGLEPAGRDADAAYFRSDARDHTLVYLAGENAPHVAGFDDATRRSLTSTVT